MRIQLELELVSPEWPADYSRLVISFIKDSLQACHPGLYQALYDKGENQLKSYTFDVFLNQAKFEKDWFKIEGDVVKLTLSTASLQDTLLLQNAFLLKKDQFFAYKGKSVFKVKKVTTLPLVKLSSSEILIKWMSPLVVLEHNRETNRNQYYDYAADSFTSQLEWALTQQVKALAPHLSTDGFELIPIQPKRVVTQSFGQKFVATKGLFKLKGDPELLQFLYDSGLGNKRSAGFGMFELV